MIQTPAAMAAISPETDFQAFTRELGLTFHAEVPLPVPAEPIVAEILSLADTVPGAARSHYCHDGSWSSIALAEGGIGDTSTPTEWMARVPHLSALLTAFGGCTGFCTVARIAPGDLLDWHYDPLSADIETARLHLPIVTNADAVTDFCHERTHWPAGTLHYGDYGFPHRVFNTGPEERIHLYFDVSGDAVRRHLPSALVEPRHVLRQDTQGMMLAHRSAA